MITFDQEQLQDSADVEALLDAAFGPERAEKSSHTLRENSPAIPYLSRVARVDGTVAATVRFTPVNIVDRLFGRGLNALLLGPLAVSPDCQGLGLGSAMMNHALELVDTSGYETIILVGDLAYYERFGFASCMPRLVTMPGGRDAHRLLVRSKSGASELPMIGAVQPGWLTRPETAQNLLPAA